MIDPIGDFIIRIKNAGKVKKESISVPSSKVKLAIAKLLCDKGYVGAVSEKSKDKIKYLNVKLLYSKDGKPVISEVKRISKPSRRIYENAKNIRKFRRGFGMSVLSTPKGIMADVDAQKSNLGGEHLFNIW